LTIIVRSRTYRPYGENLTNSGSHTEFRGWTILVTLARDAWAAADRAELTDWPDCQCHQ